ncbi:hypothetical protein F66182_4378 [Fusarium sp. NRRL 66182]|nr:hypothetical protein F66182_4378 [Fusarium sp. NRRL 66182]
MAQLLHERILSKQQNPQDDSPLFRMLPAEVRDYIFSFVLADHPDPSPSRQYNPQTCYSRPSYFAPQRTDTRVLRTCRAIYRETWFRPFLLREHTQWATSDDRAPPKTIRRQHQPALLKMLKQIAKQQGLETVEIERLRVFAQMYKLEEGKLRTILATRLLAPRTLTLTIRHTDWWFWEHDEPLRFQGCWINDVGRAMSSSTNQFCIELESLERKKDQVDRIAEQMMEKWFFKRQDGVVLFAEAEGATKTESRWSGSSTWHNQRWIRDETAPGRLDYYIVSVTFLPRAVIERRGGNISPVAARFACERVFDGDQLCLSLPEQDSIEDPRPCISVESASENGGY